MLAPESLKIISVLRAEKVCVQNVWYSNLLFKLTPSSSEYILYVLRKEAGARIAAHVSLIRSAKLSRNSAWMGLDLCQCAAYSLCRWQMWRCGMYCTYFTTQCNIICHANPPPSSLYTGKNKQKLDREFTDYLTITILMRLWKEDLQWMVNCKSLEDYTP
jgi:hypothetical protein